VYPPPPPKMYPLEISDKLALLESQGHLCAICGSKERLCIDHDHETGFVRGALCNACNTGLGMFKDNQQSLMAAIGYLGAAQLVLEHEAEKRRMDRASIRARIRTTT